MFTPSLRLSVLAALAAALPAAAQSPFDIGRVFGIEGSSFPTRIHAVDRNGSETEFTLSNPSFLTFLGIEFDAPRDRVVFVANIGGNISLGSVDASLDPATASVIRTGLAIDARHVDVDPATGRLYWWEGGQILSVGPQGNGTPVVEANNVPFAVALEIDPARGIYLGIVDNGSVIAPDCQIFTGQLDPLATPTVIDPITSGSFHIISDVAIEPTTGDLIWIESATSTVDITNSVFRSGADFAAPVAVVELVASTLTELSLFNGVSAVGTRVAVSTVPFGSAPTTPDLRIFDTTAGTMEVIAAPALATIDAEADIALIVTQPEGVLIDAGQTAQLAVESLDSAPTYRWFKNGSPLADGGRISGAATDTLTIIDAELTDTDLYTCRVTASGGEQQISEPAIIAVRGDAPPPDCPADQNFNGVVEPGDFGAWVANYNAGCP